jgi:hypothetical protein
MEAAMAHFNEIYDEARVAIADRVIELAPKANATTLVCLAEAFAWVASPDQHHGAEHSGPAG